MFPGIKEAAALQPRGRCQHVQGRQRKYLRASLSPVVFMGLVKRAVRKPRFPRKYKLEGERLTFGDVHKESGVESWNSELKSSRGSA